MTEDTPRGYCRAEVDGTIICNSPRGAYWEARKTFYAYQQKTPVLKGEIYPHHFLPLDRSLEPLKPPRFEGMSINDIRKHCLTNYGENPEGVRRDQVLMSAQAIWSKHTTKKR